MEAFMQHVADFGLSYGTIEEFNFRKAIFDLVDVELNLINAEQSSFTVAHNKFSTWTDAEHKRRLGYTASIFPKEFSEDVQSNASSVNWVTAGAVTSVKNQEACGSCWSFSTSGAMEGSHKIAGGSLENFSQQQLVNCSTRNNGCNGGNMDLAFKYYENNYAILASDYPYVSGTGDDSQSCKYSSKPHTNVKCTGIKDVIPNYPQKLKDSIAVGPTSVAIQADKRVFQNYSSGVLDSTLCGTNLDHAVLAVGYGTEGGQEYILVKNSWGTSWGDQGYIKIASVSGAGICGINMDPVRPSSN